MSATPNAFDPDDRSEHLRASPPLLPWPLLDRLTRVHPAVPALLYGPVIAVLVGYAPQLMDTRVLGVNVAYLFALSQFFMAWTIAFLYVRAARRWDEARREIRDSAGGG